MEAAVLYTAFTISDQVIMKAKIQARVTEVVKGTTYDGSTGTKHGGMDITNMTKLKLVTTKGAVETPLNNARLARLVGELFLMEVIANQMKIGATLTITISDEESDEGIA